MPELKNWVCFVLSADAMENSVAKVTVEDWCQNDAGGCKQSPEESQKDLWKAGLRTETRQHKAADQHDLH